MRTLAQRFWSKACKSKTNFYAGTPCWEWQGASNHKGYGQFKLYGTVMRTNRVAWILTHGMIADGLHVLHHCDNPRCVNFLDLFLGTNQENVDDREMKRRKRLAQG